jgi:hypothetical protein
MKAVLLCCMIVIVTVGTFGQPIHWGSTTNWKLYEVNSDGGRRFNPISNDTSRFVLLPADSVAYFITGAVLLPPERSQGIYWMGDFYASCEAETRRKLLRLSRYGGFFVDVETNSYFEIPMEKRSRWHSFLVNEYMRVQSR